MIDGIQQKSDRDFQTTGPRRRFRLRFWFGLVVLILLAVGIAVGSRVVILAQKILDKGTTPISFGQFLISSDRPIKGELEGEVRILLLGIGGAGHDGGTLTDTMILATLKMPENDGEEKQIGLVSIPRDLTVNIPGYDWRKINSAHAYGEAGGKRQGPELARQTVERIIGQSIPYYALIDFKGFRDIIDDLDGVEVDVQTGFADYQYPDGKNGYLPPLVFEQGPQTMDGDRALKFVRSRHGNNGQGSDFARADRQQQVMKAIAGKVRGLNLLSNLNLINLLLDDLADNFRTNLELHEIKRLYDITKDVNPASVSAMTISGASGLVCDQIEEETGAYLLLPCDGLGNYSRIREAVDSQFAIAPGAMVSSARIEIQNASNIGFLGRRTSDFLRQENLLISAGNFQGGAVYRESVIYDNTQGQKPDVLKYLETKLGIRVAHTSFPFPAVSENPDFIILITEDLSGKIP